MLKMPVPPCPAQDGMSRPTGSRRAGEGPRTPLDPGATGWGLKNQDCGSYMAQSGLMGGIRGNLGTKVGA